MRLINLINHYYLINKTWRREVNMLIASSVLVFCQFASSYGPINPQTLNYGNSVLHNGVEFSYKYDVLNEGAIRNTPKKKSKEALKSCLSR
jgi:hypothetical protein